MRPLQNGDLCNVDVTVYHRGFHGSIIDLYVFFLINNLFIFKLLILGDLNETLFIGEVDEKSKLLTKVTYEALMKAIDIGK